MLFQLPRTCRVFTKIEPSAQWGWSELLANKANYLLEVLAWQKTKDATKKSPRHRPKPFVPDFMKPKGAEAEINNGAESHTTDEIDKMLNGTRG